MKKIFTLFALLCAFMVNAADVYEWYVENQTEVFIPGEGVWTKSTKWNPNTKYTGIYVTAEGKTIDCKKGLKMEGATDLTFVTDRPSTVVVVQTTSSNAANTINFDGAALENGVDNPEGCTTVRVFTVEDVAAGEHHVTRGNGEAGIMYVGVTLHDLQGVQLPAPEITYVETTGEVTIAPVANATKITYTTDGSFPTDESTEYTAPFVVADGTVVKAIAIGDGEAYATSPVSELEVLLKGLTCEAPVFVQYNGTFALSTETTLASCEYSLDGENWIAYTIPVTFFENTTVKARAVRENWTPSEVVEAEIEALPAVDGTKTVYLGAGAFEIIAATEEKGGVLKGLEGGEADGYSIEINVAKKGWGKGDKITISDEIERTSYYGSNGAQNTVTLPENVKVYRVTFYSYMPSLGRASGWNNVNGEAVNTQNIVPLLSQDATKPDVRAFNLDGVEGSFTFSQTGERPNFVMALEILDETVGIENVAVDNNAAVEYYNLQGVRVNNPAGGLYIRRQGNDVKKVIL